MTKNQINYLLVLATLFVLGFYVHSGIDIFMKVTLSHSMATRPPAFGGGPRSPAEPPRFDMPERFSTPHGANDMMQRQGIPQATLDQMVKASQESMKQMPPLPPEIQKFLEASQKASKAQAPEAPVPGNAPAQTAPEKQ